MSLEDLLAVVPPGSPEETLARQVNFETIHVHDVVAERYGTVGELRGELTDGQPSARQTTLSAWLAT